MDFPSYFISLFLSPISLTSLILSISLVFCVRGRFFSQLKHSNEGVLCGQVHGDEGMFIFCCFCFVSEIEKIYMYI